MIIKALYSRTISGSKSINITYPDMNHQTTLSGTFKGHSSMLTTPATASSNLHTTDIAIIAPATCPTVVINAFDAANFSSTEDSGLESVLIIAGLGI